MEELKKLLNSILCKIKILEKKVGEGGGNTPTLSKELIKELYELNDDTNAYTDSEKTKLSNTVEKLFVNDEEVVLNQDKEFRIRIASSGIVVKSRPISINKIEGQNRYTVAVQNSTEEPSIWTNPNGVTFKRETVYQYTANINLSLKNRIDVIYVDWEGNMRHVLGDESNVGSPTIYPSNKIPQNSMVYSFVTFINGNAQTEQVITKYTVGLGNVDNTSDKDKPMSDATKTYIDDAIRNIDIPEVDFSPYEKTVDVDQKLGNKLDKVVSQASDSDIRIYAINPDGTQTIITKASIGGNYQLPMAQENIRGGVKALPKTNTFTKEVRIDVETERLFVEEYVDDSPPMVITQSFVLSNEHNRRVLCIRGEVVMTIPANLPSIAFRELCFDIQSGKLTVAAASGVTLTGYYSLIFNPGELGCLYRPQPTVINQYRLV